MTVPKQARILIIEDSVAQAAVIADIVRQAGHLPIVYHEVSAGIRAILQREEPQIVLLDLRLLDADGNQVADGFQICREIKRSEDMPVIVVSAEGDDDACEWAILQGADGFLQKPFDPEDLLSVIRQVLGGE